MQKNISTFWMKTRLIWSYVIYFQGRGSEIEPVERETIGNISHTSPASSPCLLQNLLPTCLHVRHPELNESTDIDVDQSIEDLVSQTISSSTEIHTIFVFVFFMKDDLILITLYPVIRRPPVHQHFETRNQKNIYKNK